jgi:hypothetical protein
LEDGYYTLTATVKNSNGFTQLEMYALSNDKTQVYDFKSENAAWTKITIARIPIKNGKIEIGFRAAGIANAFCYVDDVSLVKVK